MASGAAVKVAGLFSQDELTREPIIAVVNRQAPPVYSSCVDVSYVFRLVHIRLSRRKRLRTGMVKLLS